MRKFCFGLSVFLLAAMIGCAPVDVLNALTPRHEFGSARDIAYGTHARQKLDIYTPASKSKKPRDVVVFIHGGSWQIGDKEQYLFVAEGLTKRGYIAVLPNYRLAPEVAFPTFVEDSAQAILWVKKHIAEYGGNTARIFVMGHSAGAYNAVMVFALQKVPASAVKGVIGLAGPYDFLPLTDPKLHPIFAPAKPLITSQPIHYAAQKYPPLLLITGTEDTDVFPKNTRNFTAALQKNGQQVEAVYLPDIDHINIVSGLATRLENPVVWAPIESFLSK